MKIPYTPDDPNNIFYADGFLIRRDGANPDGINFYVNDKWICYWSQTQFTFQIEGEYVAFDNSHDFWLMLTRSKNVGIKKLAEMFPLDRVPEVYRQGETAWAYADLPAPSRSSHRWLVVRPNAQGELTALFPLLDEEDSVTWIPISAALSGYVYVCLKPSYKLASRLAAKYQASIVEIESSGYRWRVVVDNPQEQPHD